MKFLGSNDAMNGVRGPPNRTQDDASVVYGNVYSQKQQRWASGDDAIIDVSAIPSCQIVTFSILPVLQILGNLIFLSECSVSAIARTKHVKKLAVRRD